MELWEEFLSQEVENSKLIALALKRKSMGNEIFANICYFRDNVMSISLN